MQLKASTDYGLRTVLYLAHKGGTCSSKEISEEMLVPRDYLIQLAQLLRRAGIVDARPGKNGGYRLAKDPADITLLAVMHAVGEDSKSAIRAEREERLVAAHLDERVRRAYDRALESYDAFMGGITIASLLEG